MYDGTPFWGWLNRETKRNPTKGGGSNLKKTKPIGVCRFTGCPCWGWLKEEATGNYLLKIVLNNPILNILSLEFLLPHTNRILEVRDERSAVQNSGVEEF